VMSGSSSTIRILAIRWSLSQVGFGTPGRTFPAQEDVTAGNRRVRDADVEASGGLVTPVTISCAPRHSS
jgi:hypothetical protein